MPVGGHAVYLDMDRFFADTGMQPQDYGGIAFTTLLLAAYGHRACELGNLAFGCYNAQTGEETFPDVNFVRLAIPRLRYEEQDLRAVAEAVEQLYENRHRIPPVEITHGRDLALRHFKARFRFRTPRTTAEAGLMANAEGKT
jgi:tryptophanase